MIKKIVLILFALIVLVTFVACDAFAYREGPIKLTNIDTSEYVGELSDEQKEYLLSVWRESEWVDGITKCIFDFEFEYDGLKIKYCRDTGAFYDEKKDRCLLVTKEQCEYINSNIVPPST